MADPEAAAAAPDRAGRARLIAALVAGQLGLHASMAGLRMAASLQALHEGASPWTVGVLLALFAAAPVAMSLHSGRMADRHGYHRPVRIAAALTLVGLLLALGACAVEGPPHFLLLCAAAAASGTGANMGMLTIQRTAGVLARDGPERMRVFSWLGIAPSLANVIGPVAVGFMIDAQGFAAGYALLLALPLTSLLAARFVPPVAPRAGTVGPPRSTWDLLAVRPLRRLLAVNWLLSMCWDVHLFAVPVLGHERGFAAATVGLILGTFTLSVTGVRVLIPLLAHRLREVPVVVAAMVGTAAVFAAYPLAPHAWVMAGLAALLGIALGSVQPMVMSMLHQLTPDARHGEALALRSMAIHASSTLMPLLFGALGAAVGAGVLFWMVGGLVGAGSWIARRLPTSAGGSRA